MKDLKHVELEAKDKDSVSMWLDDVYPKYLTAMSTAAQVRLNPVLSALDTQVGGNHYKTMGIQPIEYIRANSLGYEAGNAVKYITRYKSKGGIEDLKKAIHYIQLLIEEEEKNA